jgi:hypothetical protein
MSELEQTQQNDRDGVADAVATVAIITILVCATVFWLHSM